MDDWSGNFYGKPLSFYKWYDHNTFGGIAPGEVLYRLSNLCLVEWATGGGKIVRETFSAIFPPLNSINRYFGNQTYKPGNSNIHYNSSIGGNTQFVADRIDKMDSKY